MLQVIKRRVLTSQAAFTQREASTQREAVMDKYLGGGRLAAVFASGSLPEQPWPRQPRDLDDELEVIPATWQASTTAPWCDAKTAALTAGGDAAAAGLSSTQCMWVSEQAAHVARSLASSVALHRDVAAVREMLPVARPPAGGSRAASLPVLGTALCAVGTPAASLTTSSRASHETCTPTPMDASVFSRATLDKLLCRVCSVYSCTRHGFVLAEGEAASRWPSPVTSPTDPRRLSS